MLKRISHKDFMTLAKEKGLNVIHITEKRVYMDVPDFPLYWWPRGVKPEDQKIDEHMHTFFPDVYSEKSVNLEDAIKFKQKISAIKCVRKILEYLNPNYGKPVGPFDSPEPRTLTIGLKNAKDFVEVNFWGDPNNLKANNL